jgi:membrane dipeptidase
MLVADAHCDLLSKSCRVKQTWMLPLRLFTRETWDCKPLRLCKQSLRTRNYCGALQKAGGGFRLHDKGIRAYAAAGKIPDKFDDCERYALLAIEGGEAFSGSLELLDKYTELGVKLVALTWNHENELAYPHGQTGRLKPFGKDAIGHLRKRHVGVDVSHLNQQGFWQAAELCDTLLASHSCAMALCGHSRNLTNEQIKAIIEKRGFIGINFYPPFLRANAEAGMSDIADHILHVLGLGGENAVGFGSDFDGIEVKPGGLENPRGFPALLQTLRNRGIGEETLRKIAHENFLCFLRRL